MGGGGLMHIWRSANSVTWVFHDFPQSGANDLVSDSEGHVFTTQVCDGSSAREGKVEMCVALAHPFHHFHLPAAPQGPFTPAPGSRRHSHRYLGCALARSPFSPQGQDPPAISQRSRMGPVKSGLC